MEAKIVNQKAKQATSGVVILDEIIEAAKHFDPLNPTIVKLSSMLTNPNMGLNEVSTLISFDQALTVKLLKAANSAYIGRAMRITSVQEAISFIGEFKTLNLLLSCTLGNQLRQSRLPVYDYVEGQLWRDSVLATIAAEQCSKVFRVHAPPVSATSALLLNIGKVVLSRFISTEVQEFIAVCKKKGKDQAQAEMEILNIHYGEVGGLIAQHWGLPYEITVGISFQHDPDVVKNTTSDVTHVCYKLVEHFSKEPSEEPATPRINPNVLERLQPSSKAWFDVFQNLVKDRYLKVCRSYDLPDNHLIPPNWDWQTASPLEMNEPQYTVHA